MPNTKLITQEYELLQAKIIQLAKLKAGGKWSRLCMQLPISSSHMSLIKSGKSKIGADIFCRMLEYAEILQEIESIIDAKLSGRECSKSK